MDTFQVVEEETSGRKDVALNSHLSDRLVRRFGPFLKMLKYFRCHPLQSASHCIQVVPPVFISCFQQTKASPFDTNCAVARREKSDIFWLDVTMNQLFSMEKIQTVGKLQQNNVVCWHGAAIELLGVSILKKQVIK